MIFYLSVNFNGKLKHNFGICLSDKSLNKDKMKKIYHLATCKTCQRIIGELKEGEGFELQNIKEDKITAEQLDDLKEKVGSYQDLFSRRAMKYRSMGLADKELSEDDYRSLILEEYTFLKRPVVVIKDQVFVGSAKKQVQGVKAILDAE